MPVVTQSEPAGTLPVPGPPSLATRLGPAAVVLGSGVIVLAEALAFATRMPRLRRHDRPVYLRLGILPAAAGGDLGAAAPVAASRN